MGTYDTRGGSPRHDPAADQSEICDGCGNTASECSCQDEDQRHRAFMTATKGMPASSVAVCLSHGAMGVNYTGCTRGMLADAYAVAVGERQSGKAAEKERLKRLDLHAFAEKCDAYCRARNHGYVSRHNAEAHLPPCRKDGGQP